MNRQASFPKSKRLVRGNEITRTIRRGGCAADDTLVVFVTRLKPAKGVRGAPSLANKRQILSQSGNRLGVTIPKKAGNAVQRNRWKRLIRESFRTQQHRLPTGLDIVVRPKKNSVPSWHKIRRGLPRLVCKAIQRSEQGPSKDRKDAPKDRN